MNTDVMFSQKSDEWSTPRAFWEALDREFQFTWDAAASFDNNMLGWISPHSYYGPDQRAPEYRDALTCMWQDKAWGTVWCNPPYSMCKEFVKKASEQAALGSKIVMLIPARTDTRYFHQYVWDETTNAPRPNVALRFIKGRLKFGNSTNSAPFPSMLVIFG